MSSARVVTAGPKETHIGKWSGLVAAIMGIDSHNRVARHAGQRDSALVVDLIHLLALARRVEGCGVTRRH
jgi:hypothetical protein